MTNDLSRRFQILDIAQGDHLRAKITQSRCLNRPGTDRQLACVGAELVEKIIPASAANDVNLCELFATQGFQFLFHFSIGEGQTVEDAARQLGASKLVPAAQFPGNSGAIS